MEKCSSYANFLYLFTNFQLFVFQSGILYLSLNSIYAIHIAHISTLPLLLIAILYFHTSKIQTLFNSANNNCDYF